MPRVLAVYAVILAGAQAAYLLAGERPRARLRWLAPHVATAATLLLLVGDLVQGVWMAPGFSWPLFLIGVAAVAAYWLQRLWAPARARMEGAVRAFANALNEDFGTASRAGAGGRGNAFTVLALTVIAGLLFLLLSRVGLLYQNESPDAFGYLRVLTELRRETSWWQFLTSGPLAGSLNHPFTFLLYPLLGPSLACNIRVLHTVDALAITLTLFAAGLFALKDLNRRDLLLSGLLFVAVVVENEDLWVSDHMDSFFTLLFFVNLAFVLRIRPTRRHALLVGLLTGFAFAQKQVNVINLVLAAWILWRDRTDPDRARRCLRLFLVAAGIGALPLILSTANIGAAGADGLVLYPLLSLRGIELFDMGQQAARSRFAVALPSGLWDVVWSRVTFQTAGELLFGGTWQVLTLCVTALPLPYLLANGDRTRRQRILGFAGIAFLFYGFTTWKRGNSATADYSLVPLGLAYLYPYFHGLGTSLAGHVRARHPFRRYGYLVLLIVVNVAWFGPALVESAAQILRSRYLERREDCGVASTYPFSPSEQGLLDAIARLPRDEHGTFRLSVVTPCNATRKDSRYEPFDLSGLPIQAASVEKTRILDDLVDDDREDLLRTLHLSVLREMLGRPILTCDTEGVGSRLAEALRDPGSLASRCIEVLHGEPGTDGPLLYRLNLEACEQALGGAGHP